VIFQIGEGDELRDIDFIGAAGFGIGDVGDLVILNAEDREASVDANKKVIFAKRNGWIPR
jgi:hypothetical protein